jgi:nucleoside-diphosphate-sugar epimerase
LEGLQLKEARGLLLMKIVITGGAGFIGSHKVDAVAAKHELVVLHDRPDYLTERMRLDILGGDGKCYT